jgi:hypothetical protein
MTTPPEKITVECPNCRDLFDAWRRRSINLSLGDEWSPDELREASTATCPRCRQIVKLETLVVEDDLLTFRGPLNLDYSSEAGDWIKRSEQTDDAR